MQHVINRAAPRFTSFPNQAPPDPFWNAEVQNPARLIGFKAAVIYTFFRFSMAHEVVASQLGINLFVLYIFGIPAILATIASGGVQRTLRGRPAQFWLAVSMCMIPASVLGVWPGGSLQITFTYLRTQLPIMFVLGGLIMTWDECKVIVRTIAAACLFNIVMAKVFMQEEAGRLGLEIGTIANSNDFAAHLLLVTPFLLITAAMSQKKLVRLVAIVLSAYSVVLMLRTASRALWWLWVR